MKMNQFLPLYVEATLHNYMTYHVFTFDIYIIYVDDQRWMNALIKKYLSNV